MYNDVCISDNDYDCQQAEFFSSVPKHRRGEEEEEIMRHPAVRKETRTKRIRASGPSETKHHLARHKVKPHAMHEQEHEKHAKAHARIHPEARHMVGTHQRVKRPEHKHLEERAAHPRKISKKYIHKHPVSIEHTHITHPAMVHVAHPMAAHPAMAHHIYYPEQQYPGHARAKENQMQNLMNMLPSLLLIIVIIIVIVAIFYGMNQKPSITTVTSD